MKVIAIVGSRNPDGQTASAVAALAEGVRAAGGEVETVFLPTLDIERCHQCDAKGWGGCRSEGHCGGAKDDFAEVVAKIKTADAAVFATPVYWGDLSESMRAFTDRLRRICTHENGKAGIGGKDAIGICVAGGGGGGAPSCSVSLEKVLAISGLNVLDMVPARRQNLSFKLGLLRETGKWLVGEGR
ncbi:MAG: flavodoxin family protein [Anaerolineae bacterium]